MHIIRQLTIGSYQTLDILTKFAQASSQVQFYLYFAFWRMHFIEIWHWLLNSLQHDLSLSSFNFYLSVLKFYYERKLWIGQDQFYKVVLGCCDNGPVVGTFTSRHNGRGFQIVLLFHIALFIETMLRCHY